MLIGFLNAGIMDLAQATGVIIGANIGTTITSVLIALDVFRNRADMHFHRHGYGALLQKAAKKEYRQIILGFGILFFGLKYMSGDNAMGVLKTTSVSRISSQHTSNPFLGLVIGIIMCSVLQSSNAAIGVLQMLAMNELNADEFCNLSDNRRNVVPQRASVFIGNWRKNQC
jgi:phosphate:Na+ symporter